MGWGVGFTLLHERLHCRICLTVSYHDTCNSRASLSLANHLRSSDSNCKNHSHVRFSSHGTTVRLVGMCVCVYVCMSVCMHACIHTCIYIYVYIYVAMHVCTTSLKAHGEAGLLKLRCPEAQQRTETEG